MATPAASPPPALSPMTAMRRRDAATGDVTDRRGWRRAVAFSRRGEDRGHLRV
jgi:hypothetical protein